MKDLRTTINPNEARQSNATILIHEEAERVRIHNSYLYLVSVDDNIEVRDLSDEDLQAYRDLCQNGVIDAEEELRRRGL